MALASALRSPPSEASNLSRQTGVYLRRNASAGTTTIPIPLFSSAESVGLWADYEKNLLSCLRTGNDKAAHLCLERLIQRFGATNERVMGLHGLYQEAVAQDDAALAQVLQGYDEVLADDPTNTPVAKRRIALLQSLARISDAIDALTELLEFSPTDIEAWVELSELYFSQGLYPQAIYCLEETLLTAPNAWNIHARLGEVLYVSATAGAENNDWKTLAEALRRFCRSIELCDDYLRGYYGLKLATDKFLSKAFNGENSKKQVASANEHDLPLPTSESVRRLNELAISKLAEITRRGEGGGFNLAELAAAKDLLARSTTSITR